MSTHAMPLVQVFKPDGHLADIPYDRLHDALTAGAKPARKVQTPTGDPAFVPADRINDALKAGAKPLALDLNDADGGQHGYWSQLYNNLKNQKLPPTPGSDEEAIREGSDNAVLGMTAIGTGGMGVEALSTGSLAPLAPLVRGAVGSAAGGFVGREAGKTVGQEKLGGELGALAGGIYGAGGGKIPTNAAELEEVLQTPEAKARAAQEIEGAETNRAIQMQDRYNAQQARVQATADKTAAKADAALRAPVKVSAGPGPYTGPAAARRAAQVAAEPEPSPIITSQSPDIPSEGRPATWRNMTVSDLASKGGPLSFDAATQAQLRQLDVPNVGLVANPRATIGGAGLGSSAERLARLRQIAYPDLAGGPGDFAANQGANAAEPQYLYRIRPVGEEGVPKGAQNSRAQLTSSLDQAESWWDSKNAEKPHEIIRVPVSSLKPGQTSFAGEYAPGVDWHKVEQAIPESDVEVVVPHPEATGND